MFVVSVTTQIFVSINLQKRPHIEQGNSLHTVQQPKKRKQEVCEDCVCICVCTGAGFVVWIVGHNVASMQVRSEDEGDIHDPVDH